MNIKTWTMFIIIVALFVCMPHAHGQRYYADYRYIAPPAPPSEEPENGDDVPAEKSARLRRYPLPEATVRSWLSLPAPIWATSDFSAASPIMKEKLLDAPAHHVAVGLDLNLEAAALFGGSEMVDGGYVFLAEMTSTNAFALRVNVDLTGLRQGERLWALDADGRAAFGPFTNADARDNTQLWLPTVLGDRIVLALHTPRDTLPLMMINGLSHFYRPLFLQAKQTDDPLPCNISITQETDPSVLEISTGISVLIIPVNNGQAACTATLLNGPDQADNLPTPYLLSAWHCFGSDVKYEGIEAVWDYRQEKGSNIVPDFYELPRNSGTQLIDHNAVLDTALIKLNSAVEIGVHGRAWVGWDTDPPSVGDAVQCIHHPMAAHMMTSRGAITNTGVEVCMNAICSAGYEQQLEATWREGVTEPGSSGSALLNASNQYRIAGALSNGNAHSCASDANNYDNFASFSFFFLQIGCLLDPSAACQTGYESERRSCCVMRMLGLKTETLNHLRQFRDGALGEFTLGKQLVRDYYDLSPTLSLWVEQDFVARIIAEIVATLGAAWGAAL